MKQVVAPLKQDTKIYFNDLAWINFDKYESWPYFCGYAYSISPDSIEKSLVLLQEQRVYDLIFREINFDWQDSQYLEKTDLIPDRLKHSIRVAMLMQLIPVHGVTPASIDTFSKSCSKLEGHHRLLAQKILGYKSFPAYLSGSLDELKHLLK